MVRTTKQTNYGQVTGGEFANDTVGAWGGESNPSSTSTRIPHRHKHDREILHSGPGEWNFNRLEGSDTMETALEQHRS